MVGNIFPVGAIQNIIVVHGLLNMAVRVVLTPVRSLAQIAVFPVEVLERSVLRARILSELVGWVVRLRVEGLLVLVELTAHRVGWHVRSRHAALVEVHQSGRLVVVRQVHDGRLVLVGVKHVLLLSGLLGVLSLGFVLPSGLLIKVSALHIVVVRVLLGLGVGLWWRLEGVLLLLRSTMEVGLCNPLHGHGHIFGGCVVVVLVGASRLNHLVSGRAVRVLGRGFRAHLLVELSRLDLVLDLLADGLDVALDQVEVSGLVHHVFL